MIISHRGNDNYGFLENTKEAILSTLNSNYTDGVEFDIRMTKDYEFVLSHSSFFKDKLISKTNYKDLNLDLLKNVLKSIKSKKIIIIEIKDKNELVIPILYKILKRFSNLTIYIQSFNYDIVKKWKIKYPKYKVGLIKTNVINALKDDSLFDFVTVNYNFYKPKNDDKEVFLWTINDLVNFKKWSRHKVNIITDKPYLLIYTLKKS